ncbi:MAG: AI-2E family transporter [Herpetosiphon sp.]
MTRITVPRILLFLMTVIACFWLVDQLFRVVYRIADILLIFGLAWLLKLLLDPLVRRFRSLHLRQGFSIAFSYLLFIGACFGIVLWLTPQFTNLAPAIPQLVRTFAARLEQAAIWLQERGFQIDPQGMTSAAATLASQIGSTIATRALSFAQDVVAVIGKFALVVTVSVYMSAAGGSMSGGLRPVIPPRWRHEYDEFIRDVNVAYSLSIRGYFYVVALGTLMNAAILLGFQVPGAFLWITLIFLVRLLPFVGGTFADIMSVLALVFELSVPLAIVSIVLVVLGQILLTNVLMPRVMGRELGINPMVVLFSVLIGARIYGIAGVLFAIPAASVMATVIGRAVNRFLAPLYERRGWWQEEITIAQRVNDSVDPVRELTPTQLKKVS